MQRFSYKVFKHTCLTLGFTVVGCLLTATGLVMFTIPNHIAPGGSSGFATSLAVAVPLSVGILTWMVNIPILFASIKILGIQAGVKTLLASTILSFFMKVLTSCLPMTRLLLWLR